MNVKDIYKKRLIGLDIYRIIAVLVIFLFHSSIHIKCDYGILNDFVRVGAIYMVAFFILSGYALFVSWHTTNLTHIDTIKKFYLKRGLGILPLYYIVSLLYMTFLGKETLKDDLLLAPIEILGLQSVFSTIFHISHNDGTWFVSCLMLCYLIYPYIQEILKQIQIKSKMLLILLMGFILLYSPFIVSTYRTASIYSNPFFRVLEFCIGVTIASAIFDNDNNIKSLAIFKIDPLKLFIIELIFFVVGVTYAVKMSIYKGFMLYSWIGTRIGLPMFALQIITAGNILGEYRNSVFCSVKYFCDISYAFFFAQFFTWPTTVFITQILGVKINIYRIIIALIVNITYSILFHEMAEKPITAFFKNRFKLS